MTCEGIQPRNTIDRSPSVPGSPWNGGHLIDEPVPEPLDYTIDPDYPGSMLPMYDIAQLLLRDDLMASLTKAGVDNLQSFRATILDPNTGLKHEDYSAVNIVGVVSAADMDGSTRMPGEVGFDRLALDHARPGGVLLFRLAEAVNAIVVHETVRQQIEMDGIPGMTFYESGEWSG